MEGFFTINEATDKYIESCQSKIKTSTVKTLVKAIIAGAMIAFGAAISSVAAHSVNNVGLARLAAAVVFPVGLMMVVLLGAELFTGDCLVSMSILGKKHKLFQGVKLLSVVFFGNFIGASLIAVFISLSGQPDYSSGLLGAYTIKVAIGKVNLSFTQSIVSGILCNILVCIAVLMTICAKEVTGKLLVCFFVIMIFVVGGFEHCVANMYYIPAGLLACANPEYVELAISTFGLSANDISSLNIVNFLLKNLLPVTIGNVLGGSIFVGVPIFFLNYHKSK